MDLRPGSRWKSAVCQSEVVVVRPPGGGVSLECGGVPMVAKDAPLPEGLALSPDHANGTAAGKRYCDAALGIELLGSKAGTGSLSINGVPLAAKEAKALPASD